MPSDLKIFLLCLCFLGGPIALAFLASWRAKKERLRQLIYICLTNSHIRFERNYENRLVIRFLSGPHTGKVFRLKEAYHIMSSPEAFAEREKNNTTVETTPVKKSLPRKKNFPEEAYVPGAWKN